MREGGWVCSTKVEVAPRDLWGGERGPKSRPLCPPWPGHSLLLLWVGGPLLCRLPPPTREWAPLVPVLQGARGQKVTSLTACLVDQSLRLDCRHENTTTSPIQYEFSLTREKKKHVLYGTMGVPEHSYRSRTNFTSKYNIKVLYLSSFTTKDEGTYTCELRLSGQPPVTSSETVSVLRDKLVKCEGISLLAQNTSGLLMLLLSLPLLQAMDFISL
ncbi:PREDICTED: thy-1 membrane glycoprotein isoform 1 [Odobenus rosmarus divergens]|uniref:Thy-1 membrane glycoprotein n=1 Tax=Odobenus rosmarus divergens TaxID=9708 RepID=A0A9B0H7P7_ODORO